MISTILFSYFTTILLTNFIAITTILSLVLLAAHYLITLRFLASGLINIGILLRFMPYLLVYAIPLGLCLAVGLVWLRVQRGNEQLWLHNLSRARRAWRASLLVVAGVATLLYCLCAGWWGPYWYKQAKQLLVARGARVVAKVAPQHIVSVGPYLQVWYKSSPKKRWWHEVRIGLSGGKNGRMLVAAQRAHCGKKVLTLHNGSVTQQDEKRFSVHQFKKLEIGYADYLATGANPSTRAKYASARKLWRQRARTDCWRELLSRMSKAVMIPLLPVAILWGMTAFGITSFMPVLGFSILLFGVMTVLGNWLPNIFF